MVVRMVTRTEVHPVKDTVRNNHMGTHMVVLPVLQLQLLKSHTVIRMVVDMVTVTIMVTGMVTIMGIVMITVTAMVIVMAIRMEIIR